MSKVQVLTSLWIHRMALCFWEASSTSWVRVKWSVTRLWWMPLWRRHLHVWCSSTVRIGQSSKKDRWSGYFHITLPSCNSLSMSITENPMTISKLSRFAWPWRVWTAFCPAVGDLLASFATPCLTNAPTHRGLWIRKEAVGTPDADCLAHVTLLARQHRAEGILWNGKVLGLRIKVADCEATWSSRTRFSSKRCCYYPHPFGQWKALIWWPPAQFSGSMGLGSANFGFICPRWCSLIWGRKRASLSPGYPWWRFSYHQPSPCQTIQASEVPLHTLEMRQVAQESKLEQLDGAVQECKTQLRGIPAMEGMMTKMMASLDRLEKQNSWAFPESWTMMVGPLRKTIWSGGGALFFLVCACLAPLMLATESSRSDCCLQSSSLLLVSPAMGCSSSTLEASSSLNSPWLFLLLAQTGMVCVGFFFGNIGTVFGSLRPMLLRPAWMRCPKPVCSRKQQLRNLWLLRATARTQQGCLLAQQVPRRTRLSKHTCGGQALGVAAASCRLPLHDFGEVPGTDRHRVWHYGLVLGNGVTFHLYAVYLFTGARSSTAAQDKTNVTLQAILADAALLGQQPFLIIGDWNLELIDSVLGPQLMDGSLVDVTVAAAVVHGRTPDCTFFATHSEGTRIDACVASPLAARV